MKQLLSSLGNLLGLRSVTKSGLGYDQQSKTELIQRIKQLESKLQQNALASGPARKKKERRPFDITKYHQRRIALKVAYLGWNYSGFAFLKEEFLPTVEAEIFKALKKCSLIAGPDDCNYSRGGRTDKGVSGLGQVIALDVRSSQRKASMASGEERDLPYINMINSFLPDDIRVLAWAPVSSTFHARFDCVSRTYKYFFKKDGLDLDKMREAAEAMIGSHDFRNFCLIDPGRNLPHYVRTILSFDIQHTKDDFYEVQLKGTGFLWHQVRYIMSVLFLVGQRLEPPTVTKDLLDIDRFPGRPGYPLASGAPLMLYDCEYKDIDWIYEHPRLQKDERSTVRLNAPVVTHSHFSQLWEANAIQGLLYSQCISHVEQFSVTANDKKVSLIDFMNDSHGYSKVLLGEGKHITTSKYQPLLERRLADSDAVKKEKYISKQKKQGNVQ
ncbi:pseudouridine synthase [Sporodiniella umbellata]|nr:pseudouridine synthase [Sporodiniella umbellata]